MNPDEQRCPELQVIDGVESIQTQRNDVGACMVAPYK